MTIIENHTITLLNSLFKNQVKYERLFKGILGPTRTTSW